MSGSLDDALHLIRPKHWLKNVFVLMPLPFALAAGSHFDLVVFGIGLMAMCAANSAVYVFNDCWDANRDKLHPKKKYRPVAAGRVSRVRAMMMSAALCGLSLLLAWITARLLVLPILLSYLVLQVFYCLRGKQFPLVDVFLLSSGFVLRVLLGCALVMASPSSWLLLCSSSFALFLALAKRRADLVQGVDTEHRPSLAGYSQGFLDQALAVSAGLTVMAYALYCMDAKVLIPGREFASLPFVVFGVMEYLRIIQKIDTGESPVDLWLSSRSLIFCGVAWIVAILFSVRLPAPF